MTHTGSTAASTRNIGTQIIQVAICAPSVAGLFVVRSALHDLGMAAFGWMAGAWQIASLFIWLFLALVILERLRRQATQNVAVHKPALTWVNDRAVLLIPMIAAVFVHAFALTLGSRLLLLGGNRESFGALYVDVLMIYLPFDLMTGVGLIAGAMLSAEHRARRSAEGLLADARARALQAQLEPHFLFNALSAAATLARRNEGVAAAEVLVQLGELLRTVLSTPLARTWTLREELDFARRYLAIEQVRFGDRLQVSFDIADGVSDEPVPALILQPLVDNAIKHGIAARELAGGIVRISATRRDGVVTIGVSDNGPGIGSRTEGVGITATRQRLDDAYGVHGELSLQRDNSVTVSTIVLPVAVPA